MAECRFQLLGPVQLFDGDVAVPIGGPGVRGLLALLALKPGKVVGLDEIIDALWGHDPPATARTIVHGNVSHLRRILRDIDGPSILTTPPGYRLEVEPDRIDVHRARTLLDRASAATPETAAALLAEALALWQGPALGGVPDSLQAPELEDLRRAVHGARVDADLDLGRHAELIVELSPIVRADPLAERTAGQLMRALYHAGRRGDALELYRTVSRATLRTLGVEPGAELRWLHERVLNDDLPVRDAGTPATADQPGKPISQLPAAVPNLAGRADELAWLDGLVTRAEAGETTIAIVTGTAGVGKSTLVVWWAHRVARRFPDGVLFASLRGFDPHHPPLEAGRPAHAVPARPRRRDREDPRAAARTRRALPVADRRAADARAARRRPHRRAGAPAAAPERADDDGGDQPLAPRRARRVERGQAARPRHARARRRRPAHRRARRPGRPQPRARAAVRLPPARAPHRRGAALGECAAHRRGAGRRAGQRAHPAGRVAGRGGRRRRARRVRRLLPRPARRDRRDVPAARRGARGDGRAAPDGRGGADPGRRSPAPAARAGRAQPDRRDRAGRLRPARPRLALPARTRRARAGREGARRNDRLDGPLLPGGGRPGAAPAGSRRRSARLHRRARRRGDAAADRLRRGAGLVRGRVAEPPRGPRRRVRRGPLRRRLAAGAAGAQPTASRARCWTSGRGWPTSASRRRRPRATSRASAGCGSRGARSR